MNCLNRFRTGVKKYWKFKQGLTLHESCDIVNECSLRFVGLRLAAHGVGVVTQD